MIDLHVHSSFSDGSYTPEELVDMAVAAALQTSGDKRYQTKIKEDQLNTN